MSSEAVGAGVDLSHRQAQGHVDNAASKNDASTGNAATTNHGTSGSTNRSSGIANVGTQTPVAHLPPLAKAAFANSAQPAAPTRNVEASVPTWQQQLKARLSSCRTADDFADVLKQLKDPDCQRFVVDSALNCLVSLDEINSLAEAVRDDAGLRKLVADRLWQNATHSETVRNAYVRGSRLNLDTKDSGEPQRRKEFAAQCAAGVIAALPEKELAAFLTSHSAEEGAVFALALGSGRPWREMSSSLENDKRRAPTARSIDRVLVALNNMPASPIANAIVINLRGQILPNDCAPTRRPIRPFEARLEEPTALPPQHAATAIARLWFPNDPQRADAAATYLKDLLASRQGAQLMFGAKSPWELNLVFDVVRGEPGITAQTFANYDGDPMRHPVVAAALARKLVNTISGAAVPTPEQATARAEAVQRVSDIVKTTAGQQLVSGPAPDKAKLEAWAAIIANPKITAKTFTSDNPFANTLLTDSIGPLYAVAGTVQEYPGESLRNLAGFALGLKPIFPKDVQFTGEDIVALGEALKKGTPFKDLPPKFVPLFTQHSLFPKNQALDKFVSSARSIAGTNPTRGAFEFNALFTELGPISCPAFRVQVADFDPETGGEKFGMVDNTGRTYADREDFLHHNQLPAGLLYYAPYNPLGPRDKNGAEILGRRDTPATDSRVENAVNKAALVGCFAAGIVAVVASGGTLALAAGAVGGAGAGWDTYHGLQALADRAAHGQSNNPFASGDEGRQAFMLEMGVVASGTNLGAFGVAGGFLGLSKLGAIGREAKWPMPILNVVHTGAAGVNIATLSVTAADLATNWEKMSPEERNAAAAMLVFYGVLAAKPVFELRAQPAASKPVQAPETRRDPNMPATVPKKSTANNNWGVVRGGNGQNASAEPTGPHGFDPTRGRARNDNVEPPVSNPAQQSVPIAANGGPAGGGPSFVSTDLNPAEPSAALRPPGSRWLSSPPGHQAPPTPAATPASPPATGAGPGGHPAPPSTRRAGSSPRPDSEPRPEPAPAHATPPTPPHLSPSTTISGSLERNRPDLWRRVPHALRQSGTDRHIAVWLQANAPEGWNKFAALLRDSNRIAYDALPERCKLPSDRAQHVRLMSSTGGHGNNALQGHFIAWVVETNRWDALPDHIKAGTERDIANFVVKMDDKAWRRFAEWHADNYSTQLRVPRGYLEDDPTALTQLGRQSNGGPHNRVSSDNTIELVGDLRGRVLAEIAVGDKARAFVNAVKAELQHGAGDAGKTVTVGQFVDAVDFATQNLGLDPDAAKWINLGMQRFIASDAQEGSIVSGTLDTSSSRSQTERPQLHRSDVLDLGHVMQLLSEPIP